jgi:hypothetical protein
LERRPNGVGSDSELAAEIASSKERIEIRAGYVLQSMGGRKPILLARGRPPHDDGWAGEVAHCDSAEIGWCNDRGRSLAVSE